MVCGDVLAMGDPLFVLSRKFRDSRNSGWAETAAESCFRRLMQTCESEAAVPFQPAASSVRSVKLFLDPIFQGSSYCRS
jgi:hypothetical protein